MNPTTLQQSATIVSVKKRKVWLNTLFAWLFMLPFLVFFLWFMFYPMIKGFIISFYTFNMANVSQFVGLKNYTTLFQDQNFWTALWHTVWFVIISTPTLVVVGLVLALIVNSNLKGTTFLRSAFFMPYVLSISVISSIWVFVLQPYTGLANSILHKLGVQSEIFWLSSVNLSWISILLATLWWTVGFNMVLYLAGLQEISDEYYEAASLDGANRWQKFRYITIPSLHGVTVLIVVLQTIASFKLFGQVWLMTKGGPGTATRTLVQYIYETGFQNHEMGLASAMSYVLFAITLIISILQFLLFSRRK